MVLILDSLDVSTADRITQAISKVIDGIVNHSIRSGIEEQAYRDRVRMEQYFEAIQEPSRMIRRRRK